MDMKNCQVSIEVEGINFVRDSLEGLKEEVLFYLFNYLFKQYLMSNYLVLWQVLEI